MLKLLLVAFLVSNLATTVSAQGTDEIREDITKAFGSAQVSCDNLVIAEYKSTFEGATDPFNDLWEDQHPTLIPFDKSLCEKKLTKGFLASYLEPIYNALREVDVEERRPRLSESEIKERDRKDKLALKEMQQTLQRNLQQLTELCQELGGPVSPDKFRSCYMGAPPPTASKPFSALFEELLYNTRPNIENICTRDPITPETAIMPEFRNFLGKEQKQLSWQEMSQNLSTEGFFCRNNRCMLRILQIITVGAELQKKMVAQGFKSSSELKIFLALREISIAKDKWRYIGSRDLGCVETEVPKNTPCRRTKPDRGEASGICYGEEDWHMWGPFINRLNGIGDE